MGATTLPKVDAVTAVYDVSRRVLLLGSGGAAYDDQTTQHESLWNSHHLWALGVAIDNRTCSVGEIHSMTVALGGKTYVIPLSFHGDILKVNLRKATREELTALGVIWIIPLMSEQPSPFVDTWLILNHNSFRFFLTNTTHWAWTDRTRRYLKRRLQLMVLNFILLSTLGKQRRTRKHSWRFLQIRWWRRPWWQRHSYAQVLSKRRVKNYQNNTERRGYDPLICKDFKVGWILIWCSWW